MTFEFRFRAECGTALQIGTVEAPSLVKAINAVISQLKPDADATGFAIDEASE
jgi:hypothetical protein